jgi:hypothetical protein
MKLMQDQKAAITTNCLHDGTIHKTAIEKTITYSKQNFRKSGGNMFP